MSREHKEAELIRIYKTLNYADRLICAHSASSFVQPAASLEKTIPLFEALDFNLYHSDFMGNWGPGETFPTVTHDVGCPIFLGTGWRCTCQNQTGAALDGQKGESHG